MSAKDKNIKGDSYTRFIGCQLPLCNTQFGYFNPSYKTVDQITSNLKNLILTQKGSRPMQPMFGTSIYKILFEQVDEQYLREYVLSDIKNAVSIWLPIVIIKDITLQILENIIEFNIVYVVNLATEEGKEREFTLSIK